MVNREIMAVGSESHAKHRYTAYGLADFLFNFEGLSERNYEAQTIYSLSHMKTDAKAAFETSLFGTAWRQDM